MADKKQSHLLPQYVMAVLYPTYDNVKRALRDIARDPDSVSEANISGLESMLIIWLMSIQYIMANPSYLLRDYITIPNLFPSHIYYRWRVSGQDKKQLWKNNQGYHNI